jgi:hypothetical protein
MPDPIVTPPTTPTVGSGGNPAAERLRKRFGGQIMLTENRKPIDAGWMIDAALAAERRAVVERIRDQLPTGPQFGPAELIDASEVRAILDSEASDD